MCNIWGYGKQMQDERNKYFNKEPVHTLNKKLLGSPKDIEKYVLNKNVCFIVKLLMQLLYEFMEWIIIIYRQRLIELCECVLNTESELSM